MKKLLIIGTFIVMQLFLSCQRENNLTTEEVKFQSLVYINELIKIDSVEITKDKALNFLSPTAYAKAVRQLVNLSHDQLDLWEQHIGFSSMRKAVKKIMDNTYDISNPTEKTRIASQYPNLIKIGAKGEIRPIIEATFYQNILNESGFFYINGDLCEVTESHVNIIKKEDILKTRSAKTTLSIPYCEQAIINRSPDPNKNILTGKRGRYTQMLTNVANTSNEIWLESTYKVYRNIISIGYSIPSYNSSRFHTAIFEYYVQLDVWQWFYNNTTSNWSYYKPEHELYVSNVRYNLSTDEGEIQNSILGQSNEYHFTYSVYVGNVIGIVDRNLFDTPMPAPQDIINKIPIEGLTYLYYKMGNTQYRNGIDIGFHKN